METSVLFSGFGGQGILFMGKFFAYYGLLSGCEVSWIPSYGAEMRGGTANCGVRVSRSPIGSPVVDRPDTLVCMNLPSFDKYNETLAPGGLLFVDNTTFDKNFDRGDVTAHFIAASKVADDNGVGNLSNMVMMGKILAVKGIYDERLVSEVMKKTVSARRKDMFDANLKAIELGRGL